MSASSLPSRRCEVLDQRRFLAACRSLTSSLRFCASRHCCQIPMADCHECTRAR
ncbi:hypothetical protein [Equine adenovirus 1]|uniref:Uncharacterized protein n=1 Tax=Equine adenovirus A serotype 1 TaxID=46916 RepID=A0A1B0XBB5_ADEE1|nr:hypothetical protein [Equine adenovirus 1]